MIKIEMKMIYNNNYYRKIMLIQNKYMIKEKLLMKDNKILKILARLFQKSKI